MNKIVVLFLGLIFLLGGCRAGRPGEAYIASVDYGVIGGEAPCVKYSDQGDGIYRVTLSWTLHDSVRQDDWHLTICPAFVPDFHWAPHLTPEKCHIIGQHVFRSPALIVRNDAFAMAIVPDLDMMSEGTPVPVYMDMDAPAEKLMLGMSLQQTTQHVLYERVKGAVYPPGKLDFSFYLICSDRAEDVANPFRRVLSFLWDHWGEKQFERQEQHPAPYEQYVRHTYDWAFKHWEKHVWQQFTVGGKEVGAPVFIVNTTQSPNYPGEVNEREFRSIWNQAWFSSLRSASGLFRYARRHGDSVLMKKALMTKELALAFPQREGLFYGVVGTRMVQLEKDGKKYNRSAGWETRFWGNSNRNPYTWDASRSPFHILDMSWTALLMLRWYDELERDDRLLEYVGRYAERLLKLQSEKGYFPAWIDTETGEVKPELSESPESAMSVTFLLKLYELTGRETYRDAALKAMDVIIREIVPVGRWEDFETYWSCCRLPMDMPGRKVPRNDMYKQCTFSMFWTAEALFECYKVTGKSCYLTWGERVLDELLMAQASWQPPYIHVSALGGFGVMNADGEWNDSRQSLFAELILDYGKAIGRKEYEQRGMAALRSSFVMMYCPENPAEKRQWEYVWPFFNEKDYGFTMENYAHGGTTSDKGIGIGEFTIYDWGNGAAAEAYNRIYDHHLNKNGNEK